MIAWCDDRYSENHEVYVTEAFEWLCENCPEVIKRNEYSQRFWLQHILGDTHRWQHWILKENVDIPLYYHVVEMVCDLWAFSWSIGEVTEIFTWYGEHKDVMKINDTARVIFEDILGKIKEKLEDNK